MARLISGYKYDGLLVARACALLDETFGASECECVKVFAPGRVNIIGEHTDYNDGFVLPCALGLRTVAVGRIRKDSKTSRIVSANASGVVEFVTDAKGLAAPEKSAKRSWGDYVRGVVAQYADDVNEFFKGDFAFEAAFVSNVPLGGGLSSSASLEVATAIFLEQMLPGIKVDAVKRALRCVEAEHTHAHVPCGIMDQTVSSCALEDHLLLIDCRSLELTPVQLGDASVSIVIANSNVSHSLTGSEYPDRVNECARAVRLVRASHPETADSIKKLRDVSISMLEHAKSNTDMSKVCYRRARHAVTEDSRTEAVVRACRTKDYPLIGKLMLASHESLRDDFEVSTSGLDLLVELAMQVDGVYGSRMTGGGFGGCTVTLCKTECVPQLLAHLSREYEAKTGVKADCFVTSPGSGAAVIVD